MAPSVNAQSYSRFTTPKVYVNNQALANPWAGGLNSASYQTIDLNNDGLKDLFVFEKQSESTYPGVFKIRTFINTGSAGVSSYTYDPNYEQYFPQDMVSFCMLIDYNGDGREDIFTYNRNLSSIDVYRNDFNSMGVLHFTQEYSGLNTCYLNSSGPCFPGSLYVLPVNQPAIYDINGDGDLDILTFQIAANFIEYHENMAKEWYNRTDTIVLVQKKAQWGHVSLSGMANVANLGLPRSPGNNNTTFSNRHSGSCMVAFDSDGDGMADILNGDLLGNNLLFLHNGGTQPGINDSIDWQDINYPSNGSSVNYITFINANFLDADNDGKTDMLISSCTESQSENYNNNLLYHNAGTNQQPDFQFSKSRFLTDGMIDVGTAAMPVFFDIDNDGRKDLIIGNKGYYITQGGPSHYEGALAYYKNTSTGTCPEFTQVSNDFANLQQYGFTNIYPAFGDLDGDGDIDMLIGNENGTFHYFMNIAGAGNTPQFALAANGFNFQNLDVGSNSTPQLIDVDNDGLLDIVSGELFGKIYYFRNTGTVTSPSFTLQSNNWGGINITNSANTFYGYSVPYLFTDNGQWKLLVGSESGRLFLYDNISGNLSGTFNLVSSTAYGVNEPPRAAPALADLNADGQPEIIVGTQAGGLSFYSASLPGCPLSVATYSPPVSIQVNPNPANNATEVTLINFTSGKITAEVMDISGRKVFKKIIYNNHFEISTTNLSNGIYMLVINTENGSHTKKLIVHHE
ncbi:MAG: T9SS type A sorting domain-containing protein [Bacteroidetes bacterium]|jgi:hypothetical protein|nr:T9SS type A sorting domain-containing protein [Bacteroidota bacterium]